ncbi:MAG: cytochrome-c peroxidase [Deltaproteobacteria bacterium]|jgi:cytochrome c peroxidase|nr:MAG: cytochrome-c peroxidase [Deltaproteobacteria bacterium]
MRKFNRTLIGFLILVLTLSTLTRTLAQDSELLKQAQIFFKPLPKEIPAPSDNPTTPQKVQLGKKLFFDPRLSLSGVISCNTCHNISTYGVDNLETSIGHGFQRGSRNAPTVLNAGLHIAQFWDGRAKDLEEQAKGPILNPVEMAMPDEKSVVERIKSIPEYVDEFKKAFGGSQEPITYDNIARAIAAFERTLVTPSRFDRFLNGDTSALTEKEKEGLKLFISKGCVSCHNGIGVGGGMYQKFGIVKPYPYQKDLGRYEITKKEEDRYVFKVPSLRNVTRTYPYFHDGKVWNIKEAVRIMGEVQLGITLSEDEVDKIVAFLDSLTGEIPKEALEIPVLPPATTDTFRFNSKN